jgi:SSS family solute:Na+ symporter
MDRIHTIGTQTDWVVMIVYLVAILLFGSYFSKYNHNTTDFFFGGRRFSWWLIAMSIVATGVSSHSFVKYSAKAWEYGFSSSMAYMNDWFFIPFFMFGWLPIVVYSKIRSIPEYFEKRFSPSARFFVTILQLLYLVGYIGIGFLTMGKAILPLMPPTMSLFGLEINITLMGLIIVIAFVTGAYTTFGGQIAVLFTDLVQGFMLLLAGLMVFIIGIDYVGGWHAFWNLLPTEWKMPLAHYNKPSDFNFVGIFWQDGIAGSVGFLFMNMGLIMRFMSAKSVNEGRKAATFNILFMLPVSAIVVSGGGWVGKAMSMLSNSPIPANTEPDFIFVVVANIIMGPGVFGFVVAALAAALMSTVNTLLNASSAVYVNDIYNPMRIWLKKLKKNDKGNEKRALLVARIATVAFTILGVLAVIPFSSYPTVYEAHGYFHSTLTPPLVIAIFLGVFWKKFTPAGVIATVIGGVSLMVLGAYYPGVLIAPFDHGTPMDPVHPYTYIGALYNTFVCLAVGVIVTLFHKQFTKTVNRIKKYSNRNLIMSVMVIVCAIFFMLVILNIGGVQFLFIASLIMTFLVSMISSYYIKYDPIAQTEGLTVSSLHRAKEMFKGSKLNERDGEIVKVNWNVRKDDEDFVNLSKHEMNKMNAEVGDLIYVSDARKYLGGLKSFHSTIGEPHAEEGIIYISKEHLQNGLLIKGRLLTAEKEM